MFLKEYLTFRKFNAMRSQCYFYFIFMASTLQKKMNKYSLLKIFFSFRLIFCENISKKWSFGNYTFQNKILLNWCLGKLF